MRLPAGHRTGSVRTNVSREKSNLPTFSPDASPPASPPRMRGYPLAGVFYNRSVEEESALNSGVGYRMRLADNLRGGAAVERRRQTTMQRDHSERPEIPLRNVLINGRRTSVRLESLMWDSLREIARDRDMTVHQLATEIAENQDENSLTAAIRMYIVQYYKSLLGQDLRRDSRSRERQGT